MSQGVSVEFFGGVVELLAKQHGDRFVDVQVLLVKLAEIERIWKAAPTELPDTSSGEQQ